MTSLILLSFSRSVSKTFTNCVACDDPLIFSLCLSCPRYLGPTDPSFTYKTRTASYQSLVKNPLLAEAGAFHLYIGISATIHCEDQTCNSQVRLFKAGHSSNNSKKLVAALPVLRHIRLNPNLYTSRFIRQNVILRFCLKSESPMAQLCWHRCPIRLPRPYSTISLGTGTLTGSGHIALSSIFMFFTKLSLDPAWMVSSSLFI